MKTSLLVCTLLALLVTGGASAQEPEKTINTVEEAKEAMCKDDLCQRDLRILLKLKDGKSYDKTFDVFPPVVQDIGLMVAAGQKLNIEAEVSGDTLINFKVVKEVVDPKKTIVVSFTQEDDGGMMLSVSNPFERTLKFNMAIMPIDKEALYKTSSCPILAGGRVFEMWPEPIFQILLTNPKLLDDKDQTMVCIY
ncbi:MAG: hypothetical protein ACREO1_12650 [Arenimonas sp.]